MRVITGTARGARLETPKGLDIRPTSEVAKEAIFSMLQFEMAQAAVLDLFAGSGQLGIEALSRGARLAVFVDSSRDAQDIIRANLTRTKLAPLSRVATMDAGAFLTTAKESFDIAFLDPPYGKKLIDAVLPLLVGKMSDAGVIVCETEAHEVLPEAVGDFYLHKVYRYGKAKVTTYRRLTEEQ